MRKYTIESVEHATCELMDKGYTAMMFDSGCLGLGGYVLCPPSDNQYFFITTEIYQNEWSSAQTWRRYRQIPKWAWEAVEKYEEEQDKME